MCNSREEPKYVIAMTLDEAAKARENIAFKESIDRVYGKMPTHPVDTTYSKRPYNGY